MSPNSPYEMKIIHSFNLVNTLCLVPSHIHVTGITGFSYEKSNTIELTVHTSCYCVLDLLLVNMNHTAITRRVFTEWEKRQPKLF